MINSLTANYRNGKYLFYNFELQKNIPIDSRYIVSTLKEEVFNVELPYNLRYPGLVFFVNDASVSDGTDLAIKNGILYTFESDLNKPIPLYQTTLRYINFGIEFEIVDEVISNYDEIETRLNKTFAKVGMLCTLFPLNVTFKYCVNSIGEYYWEYFAGDYHINNEIEWYQIAHKFMKEGATVIIGKPKDVKIKKIITAGGVLSEQILKYDSYELITIFEENRFYEINGFLHYYFAGKMHKIGDKYFIRKNFNMTPNIIIEHGLKTTLISAIYRIISLNKDYDKTIINLGIRVIDENKIQIDNEMNLTGDLLIVSTNF